MKVVFVRDHGLVMPHPLFILYVLLLVFVIVFRLLLG